MDEDEAAHVHDTINKLEHIRREGDHVTGMRSNLQGMLTLHQKMNDLPVKYDADVNGKRNFLKAHEILIKAYTTIIDNWYMRRTSDEDGQAKG